MSTASLIMSWTTDCGSFFAIFEYSRHAKSVCSPSSLLMSSLLKHRPGRSPRFFSQKMEQKEPLKKMPSMQAKARRRCAKELEEPIHFSAHAALDATDGMVL